MHLQRKAMGGQSGHPQVKQRVLTRDQTLLDLTLGLPTSGMVRSQGLLFKPLGCLVMVVLADQCSHVV